MGEGRYAKSTWRRTENNEKDADAGKKETGHDRGFKISTWKANSEPAAQKDGGSSKTLMRGDQVCYLVEKPKKKKTALPRKSYRCCYYRMFQARYETIRLDTTPGAKKAA